MGEGPIRNVIVAMFDSWQWNYTGCYGNDWIKTPNFDRFAREGVLFENAYGEGMPTVPVRRALHTGRTTLHETGWSPLRMQDTTIADLCWGQGVDTALIFDCPMYRLPKYGYTRGFDKVYFLHGHEADHDYYARNRLYHARPEDFLSAFQLEHGDEIVGGDIIGPLLHEIEAYLKHRQYWKTEEDQNVCKVMRMAVRYLEHVDRNQPFYLWIDNFDPHEPWDPPSVHNADIKCPYDPDYDGPDMFLPMMDSADKLFTERELEHIRALYAEKVTLCDTWFGYLMEHVRRLGLEENTMIVLISDHGEPLGNAEHGHGIMRKCRPWPYEELVHIPLMIKAPGLPAGKRLSAFVQNYDITPTITNWLGVKGAENMHGIDLWPLMTGRVEKIRDFALSGYFGASVALNCEAWSYVHWLANERIVKSNVGNLLVAIDGVDTSGRVDVNPDMVADSHADANTITFAVGKEDMQAFMEYSKTMTLDGADQWTCTPGARAEVPAHDELYDRKLDPFQLNNVIAQYPDVARELLQTIRIAMGEYKAG